MGSSASDIWPSDWDQYLQLETSPEDVPALLLLQTPSSILEERNLRAMDPTIALSVAASVISVVSLASTALKQLAAITQKARRVQHIDGETAALRRELCSLDRFLRRLQKDVPKAGAIFSLKSGFDNDRGLERTAVRLAEATASCSGDLYALERKLCEFFDEYSLEPPFYDFGNAIKPIFLEPTAFSSGGTGQVFRVRNDYDYGGPYNDGARDHTSMSHLNYYAVKKLNSSSFHDFSREVSNLQHFTRKPHPHIVPLLGSYRMGGQYHLIFPWADCDLAMYWRLNPEPNIDKSRLEWFSSQLMGLADAISRIHGLQYGKEEPRRRFVHGDIKPANILCFSDNISQTRLTLADFGLSHFHSLGKSQASRVNNVKHTPVYRAPEVDITSQGVTQAFDIWSLGCVISEALVWMMTGNAGLQELSSARFDRDKNSPNRDAFFQLHWNASDGLVARLKPEVQSLLLSLRDNPRSTPFSNDMLDLVLDGMLRIDMHQRLSSRDVYSALTKMCKKLADDSTYSEPCGGHLDGGAEMALFLQTPFFATRSASLTNSGFQVHSNQHVSNSNQHTSRRRRLDMTVNANYYTNVTTQSLSEPSSRVDSKSGLKFACPFFKSGILVSASSRTCMGPGFETVARLKEHLSRRHTTKKYNNPRVCKRCDDEFKTEELFLAHQHQSPPCLIRAPEIIYGMLDREQAANLQSTKRKSINYSDEERWFDIYKTINPSYDPRVDKVSPYHESNTTSLDTLSTQSSNGISEYMDYLQKPLTGNKLQEFAAEMGASLGISNPEVCMAWAAKLRDFQLKDLEKFNEDKSKPAYTYEIGANASYEKVEAVDSSGEQVPVAASPLSQFLALGNDEEFRNPKSL
ncbi:hypothetical protein FSARC_7590 [Fusarium sarcochroum]|uniref:Protein kinase domain-containing protein n=1 Tax=Fusarium sarcochroum TaxID=1208366 RepID=A0A8H4X780_9HYPO|nr:hypothetical protein FSARC_7590 [Fusarium sarcochroum]